MTNFKKAEVYLARVVFTDGTSTKKRPVVVLSSKDFNEKRDEIIVAAITSNVIRKIYGDVKLKDWKKAGLLYPSVVTGIIFTLKKKLIYKKLGKLTAEDVHKLSNCLNDIFKS